MVSQRAINLTVPHIARGFFVAGISSEYAFAYFNSPLGAKMAAVRINGIRVGEKVLKSSVARERSAGNINAKIFVTGYSYYVGRYKADQLLFHLWKRALWLYFA